MAILNFSETLKKSPAHLHIVWNVIVNVFSNLRKYLLTPTYAILISFKYLLTPTYAILISFKNTDPDL